MTVAFLLRLLLVFLNFRDLPLSDHFEAFGAEMGWTARSLALGQGFSSPFYPTTGPTALVPPVYPALLAGIFRIFGLYSPAAAFAALALNSLFSSLTAAVLFVGTRRAFGKAPATWAAWIWALYPFAIYFSAVYLWDFALTSLLFACCFFLATTALSQMGRPAWAGYGLLYGLTVLCNPSVLTLFPVLVGFAAWQRPRRGMRMLARPLLATTLLLATLLPWIARNTRVMHHSVLIRDGFWGEFYAGNAGDTSRSNPGWTHPASNPAEMRRYQERGEIGYMAEKERLSLQQLHNHPADFVLVSGRRWLRFWTGYWSFSKEYLRDQGLDSPNVPFCTSITLFMIAGTWALFRRSPTQALPYLLVFLIFPLPYYVTHASMDYRQPIEPMVVVTAVWGGRGMLRRWRMRHDAGEAQKLNEVAAQQNGVQVT